MTDPLDRHQRADARSEISSIPSLVSLGRREIALGIVGIDARHGIIDGRVRLRERLIRRSNRVHAVSDESIDPP